MAAPQITDRAKRYRAVKAVTGPKVCVLCGAKASGGRPLDVMHLSGNESDGEKKNLAYGCRRCNATLAAAFKSIGAGVPTNQYNPATKAIPTYEQYAWAVSQQQHSGEHGEAGAIIHATPKSKRIEYARTIARKAAGTKRDRFDERWNPALGDHEAGRTTAGMSTADRARALKRHIQDVEEYLRRKLLPSELQILKKRFRDGVKEAARRNPASASAEVFEEFHGYPSNELIVVKGRRHHHEHVAAAGELAGLTVRPVGRGLPDRNIEGMGEDAFLTFNEAKNQLFITGGDQKLSRKELKAFGITEEHELQTVGKLIAVGYFTDKKHLGDEGGEAVYSHTFRTTNENGRHITVKIARYPDLIYRVIEEQFEISGGSYTIRAEGIDV